MCSVSHPTMADGSQWGHSGATCLCGIQWDARIRKTLLARGPRLQHQRSRFLARLCIAEPDSDIATRKPVLTLRREGLRATEFSTRRTDRGAGSHFRFRSSLGQWRWPLARGHQSKATSPANTGLSWLDNHPFVVSGSKIKHSDASTGPTVSRNGQLSIPTRARARPTTTLRTHRILYKSRRHILGHGDTVSSNTLKTYAQSHSRQRTGLSQLVERAGKSPSIVRPASM